VHRSLRTSRGWTLVAAAALIAAVACQSQPKSSITLEREGRAREAMERARQRRDQVRPHFEAMQTRMLERGKEMQPRMAEMRRRAQQRLDEMQPRVEAVQKRMAKRAREIEARQRQRR